MSFLSNEFFGAVHFLDQRTRLTKQNEMDKPGRLNTGELSIENLYNFE